METYSVGALPEQRPVAIASVVSVLLAVLLGACASSTSLSQSDADLSSRGTRVGSGYVDSAYSRHVFETAGLVTYWPLDDLDDVLRERRRGQDETYMAPVRRGRPGVSGTSVEWRVDQFADVPRAGLLSMKKWTVELWFRPSAGTDARRWLLWESPKEGTGFAIQGGKDLSALAVCTVSTRRVASCHRTTRTHPTLDGWNHVVATFDGRDGGVRLHVNGGGTPLSETQSYRRADADPGRVLFGGLSGLYSPQAADAVGMDEVAIYSRVLSATEIGDHYRIGRKLLTLLERRAIAPKLYLTDLPSGFELERVVEQKPPLVPVPEGADEADRNVIGPTKERTLQYVRRSPQGWIELTTREMTTPDAGVQLYWVWRQAMRSGSYRGTEQIGGRTAVITDGGPGRGVEIWWQENDYVAVVMARRGKDSTISEVSSLVRALAYGNVCEIQVTACD